MPGIYDTPSQTQVARTLEQRIAEHLQTLSDEALRDYLAEAVYLERRRFADAKGALGEEERAEQEAVEAAARATHRGRREQEQAVLQLVGSYAREIHNPFSRRTYRFATTVLPGALTRLLTASRPRELLGANFDPASRILVQGPTDLLGELAKSHTLVFAPTHVSNLDSPLIGYALYSGDLPPVIYGAGLNLFSNPVMGFFMRRLGAYTVDRRKKHRLYKDVLKAYSVDALGRRCHSLFFPGGTRSRSGMVEKRLKKGLLGTGIIAWQEGLAARRPHPEILVVPCTLSFALVLEAETLIEDSLAEEGKSRYIITDDEFSEPRVVASFASRVLNLDASVYLRFGRPLDLLGNPVDDQGRSLDYRGQVIDRRQYVTNAEGEVVNDEQRDRIYTEHLSQALVEAWHKDNVALTTHVAGFAAWQVLRTRRPELSVYQLVFTGQEDRLVDRRELLQAIEATIDCVQARAAQGSLREALPRPGSGRTVAEAVLDRAVDRFARFHKRCALEPVQEGGGAAIRIDPRLVLYYGNRLVGYGLEPEVAEAIRAFRRAQSGGST